MAASRRGFEKAPAVEIILEDGFAPVTAKLSSRGPGVPTETGVQSIALGPSARNGWFTRLLNVSVEIPCTAPNAVLSLIRARPQQADEALESLSDLFRAAMRDPSELVSLADEIQLGRQYLELENLRLGERLAVDWKIGAISLDLPIPPLMLDILFSFNIALSIVVLLVWYGVRPRAT